MKKRLTLAFVFGILAAAAGAAVYASKPSGPRDIHPAFAETKWPFLMDQWGTGRAYRCDPEDCGTQVDVYLRAKIGFCNCTTGVSDDQELERVGDVELLGDKFSAPAPGREITVAWMKGRSRPYDVAGHPNGSTLAFAFNDHCDVIVATAVVPDGPAARVEPAVLAFLNSDTVIHWAEKVLGL
ncbi:MAG TPA: hypothetical protein VGH49_10350 [Xanthobacteraceae bacterium]|jgi:hypothetical protein